MTATCDPTIQNLNLRQIMASFAYLAYCGQGITDKSNLAHLEAEILGLIEQAMPQIPPIAAPNPLWNVVWGPAVFTMPGALYQDNMMFVVQNQADKTQFAIAIRGTNFVSDLDWLMEDLDILQLIPWPPALYGAAKTGAAKTGAAKTGAAKTGAAKTGAAKTGAAKTGAISESTSIDLQILLAMKSRMPNGDVRTLQEFFLKDMTPRFPTGINLCVTGHSLGGCVAGTLALYLRDNPASWDATKNSFVCCITFAAPSAGNVDFATYSDGQFADQSKQFPGWDQTLGTNFDAVRCTLDVAWMAWQTHYVVIAGSEWYPPLLNIYKPTLYFYNAYGGTAFSSALTDLICPTLQDIMGPLNYKQVVAGATPLTGTFNGDPPKYWDYLSVFLEAFYAQAKYQHGSSYPCLLCVPQLNDSTIIVTQTPPSSSRIFSERLWQRVGKLVGGGAKRSPD